MVNPGAFQGSRKEFLTAQIALYATAVTENHVADTVADIQRRYFKRYPVSLAHTEEPSAEWIAQVDDNAADDDLLLPDSSLLDEAAFKVAQTAFDEHVKLLKFRKDQIARRLAYQHAKSQNSSASKRIEVDSEDPMVVLLAKLANVPIRKPRQRSAYTIWGQKNHQFVDVLFEERVKEQNVPRNKRAALRMHIYKECFSQLDEDERKDYEAQAIEDHRTAVEKIEQALNAPPSQNPEDRQQILQGLPKFIQPILNLITDYTGWKATLLVGGPEPADQGRLNVMSFHSGTTRGDVKMNFGRSERRAYKEFVTPVFGSFLKKCYTVEDCRAAALPHKTAVSLAEVLQLDGGEFSVDSTEASETYIKVARTPGRNGGFNTPSTPNTSTYTYEIPSKIGPPIHLKKKKMQSTLNSSLSAQRNNMPYESEEQAGLRPSLERQAPPLRSSCPPSPHLSTAPSPAPSLRASPIPIVSSSSPIPTPNISRAPTPQHTLTPQHMPATPGGPLTQPLPHGSSAEALPETAPIPQLVLAPHLTSPICQQFLSSLPGTSVQRAASPAPPIELHPALHGEQSPTAFNAYKRRHDDRAGKGTNSDAGDNAPRKRLRSSRDEDVAPSTQRALPFTPEMSTFRLMEPLTPEELSACPNWFLSAYQMFLSEDLGPAWQQLVRAWAHFEESARYEEHAKLGTKGRPTCVGDWIARARSTSYRPNIEQLPLFEKAFNAWWKGLQPEWRLNSEDAAQVLQRKAGNLEDLHRPGKNGLLSVLAALFFWGVKVSEKESGVGVKWTAPWKFAVDDVHWVIQNLSIE